MHCIYMQLNPLWSNTDPRAKCHNQRVARGGITALLLHFRGTSPALLLHFQSLGIQKVDLYAQESYRSQHYSIQGSYMYRKPAEVGTIQYNRVVICIGNLQKSALFKIGQLYAQETCRSRHYSIQGSCMHRKPAGDMVTKYQFLHVLHALLKIPNTERGEVNTLKMSSEIILVL